MNLFEKLLKISSELKTVEKGLEVQVSATGKYKAVGEADVLRAIKPLEEKYGIYSIGTYGCCQSAEYKHHLREGLRSFIKEIEPEIILVYGSMSDSIFGEFKKDVQFVHFDNWSKIQHEKGGKKNG